MNKFNARKKTIDGIRFDSAKEAERYLLLRDMQRHGEIYALQCHKKFVIVEPQHYGKHKIRERCYIADFAYYLSANHELVVEDAKGMKKGVVYQLFTLKKALMLQKYGIWVNEI